jgi:hypothetical protein
MAAPHVAGAGSVTAGRPGGGIDGVLRELALAGPASGSDFSVLDEAVRAHAPSCAACLHVFLKWDAPRAALVQSLHGLGLAQLVLVVGAIPGVQEAAARVGKCEEVSSRRNES